MFSFFRKRRNVEPRTAKPAAAGRRPPMVEGLEGRRLLSASLPVAAALTASASSATVVAASSTATSATATKIAYSDAPAAVKTGLAALAQGTTIADAHFVRVKTLRDGTVTYTTSVSVNGRQSKVAVDADGNPLAGKIAFADAPSVVQTGLQAQLTGVTLSSEQVVTVRARGSTVVYSTTYSLAGKTKVVAASADGTAVDRKGRELEGGTTVTYADAPDAVKAGLAKLAQGTAIADDQVVDVLTLPDGSTVYAALLSINGEPARASVAADGTLLEGAIAFADAPSAVRTGLQTLATGGTIPDDQLVAIHTRPGGDSTYSTSVELDNDATIIAVSADGTEVATNPWGGRGHGGDDLGGDRGGGDDLGGRGRGGHGGPGGGDFGGGGPGGGDAADRTTVTFADAPSAVQIGLQKLTLGTTIADAQPIEVRTFADGSTVYATVLAVDGEPARVAVAADGTAVEGLIAFADAPSAVKTGLQTLATGGTIADDATVRLSTRPASPDGSTAATTVYSTTVTIDGVATRIAVDATGAAVQDGFGRGGGGPGRGHGGPGDRGGFGGGFRHGPPEAGDGSTSGDTAGGTTDASGTTTPLAAGASNWFGGSLGGTSISTITTL
ncbi:MAG TPA: hypothetical protein VF796_14055 [Humisphaera sp.]